MDPGFRGFGLTYRLLSKAVPSIGSAKLLFGILGGNPKKDIHELHWRLEVECRKMRPPFAS